MMEKQLIPAGYKQTEVGVIPEDWDVSLLKNLTVDMLQGVNTAIDIPEYVEGGIPMLKANNVIDQVVKFSGADSISLKTFLSYSDRYRLKKDDFLFSNIGARLGTGSLLEVDIDCSFAWNVMRIVPDQRKIKPKFLAYQINSPRNSEKIKSEQSGSGMGFIPKSTMQKVTLALPSDLDEQTAIANALSDVDALIAALEKLINKKSAIKTAAMQQLLTGKKRLPPFDQLNTGYKQTELGEIPGDWEVGKFTDVTNLITCGIAATPKYVSESIGYPFLSSTNVKNGKVVWKNYKHISRELHSQLYKNNPPLVGDVLYSRVGTIGEAAVIEDEFEFSVYVSLTLIKPKKELLNSYYLMQLLNSESYKNRAREQVYMGGGVGNLNVDVVRNYPIVVPSLAEQTAIANVLSDMDKDLEALQQRLHKTQQIKQGMMQELLTGKTRLV
jgi:type I restriction enzyme, S subunit